MKDFLISVIIPVYNAEYFLKDAFDSLMHQDVLNDRSKRIFEVVFVDDGSTDSSLALCNGIKNEYPEFVSVLHQKNSGQIKARLNGAQVAKGEYIVFLDADDTLNQSAISTIVQEVKESAPDVIVYNAGYINKGKRELFWPDYKSEKTVLIKDDMKEFRRDMITTRRFNNVCLKVFKSVLFDEPNQYYDIQFLRTEEDLVMQLPLIDKARSVVYLPEDLYTYRYNADSVTHRFVDNLYKNGCYVYEQRCLYGKKWNIKDYERGCNTLLIRDFTYSLKLLQMKNDEWSLSDKIAYIKELVNDGNFRRIFKAGNFDASNRQRVMLITAYLRLWPIILILVGFGSMNYKISE